MDSKKSKADLLAENRSLRAERNSAGIANVLMYLIKYGAFVWISYHIFLMVTELAGKHTFADIGFAVFGNLELSVALGWWFGIGGILYGLWQAKLRKDTIERLQNRIQFLESKLDGKRTSSQLTPRGDTRKEDEL